MLEYNEKAYRKIGAAGSTGIAVGVIIILIGIAAGVLSIVFGAKALSYRKYLID